MRNKGFTLAELLAVIVILGLVAVIAVPAVTKTLGGTKSELCEDQLKNIKEVIICLNYQIMKGKPKRLL